MAMIDCDTQKMRNCGEDIVTLANDFNSIMQNIFSRINNLNKKDEAWSGIDAEVYIQTVLKDKEIYGILYEELKTFGLNCQLSADIIEDNIRKSKING